MAEFHFLRPEWFIALLPMLFILWRLWHQQHQSRSWQSVCDPRLLPFLLVGTAGRQRRWPILITGLMGTLIITALAGPVWHKIEQPVFREQSSLVVVLDLSRSMDATDIKPSRLARARHKLIDILRQRKEGQTALIVYAGNAYTVSPLTDDSQTMLAMVKTLKTELMPQQGSQTSSAIQRAVALLKQAGATEGHILLVTDEVRPVQTKPVLKHLTNTAYRLSILGVGTTQGAPVTLDNGGFLTNQSGEIVIAKLNSPELQKLASSGGGVYQTLRSDDRDIQHLLTTIAPARLNAERETTSMITDHWREEGPWLLFLVLPFAALAFRRGYLFLLLVLVLPGLPEPAYAVDWDHLWQRADQKAAQQLKAAPKEKRAKDNLPSADVFTDPAWKAAAQYRAGQYQQAVESLKHIDTADGWYNKGNALAKQGQYPEAIKAYDEALKRQANHDDAKYNRQQVEKILQQQSQKQDGDQQQSDQQQSDQQQSDNQQSENKQSGNQNQDSEKQADSQQNSQSDERKEASSQQQNQQQADTEQNQQQEESAEEQTEQTQQAQQTDKQDDKQEDNQQAQQNIDQQPLSQEEQEQRQAVEQWLRRIPDDPGGLLRRKFQYEYDRKRAEGTLQNNSGGQQAW